MTKLIADILSSENVKDVFVDCGQGDKFLIKGVSYSENDKSLILQIDKSVVKWIEIDGRHPIKLTAKR